ncbi:hypothetical protein [Streptacidiphilus melanogenes]|uniref:hypothetical protein n=1 Tax=Streptacidiphilus melanogenes TaxID=411235 RepID=UPI001F41D1FF|nr:hypothetical protein [Streptacidiphilus melanogenes]
MASTAQVLTDPVRFGERTFTEGFRLDFQGLAPFREGVALRDLVPQLAVFPDPATWSVWMRRTALALPPADAELVTAELRPLLRPYGEVAEQYRWEPAAHARS